MYRLQRIIRNYGFRFMAWQAGHFGQEALAAQVLEPFMTARTRQLIEQRVALQIRRRLIKKALEEE